MQTTSDLRNHLFLYPSEWDRVQVLAVLREEHSSGRRVRARGARPPQYLAVQVPRVRVQV